MGSTGKVRARLATAMQSVINGLRGPGAGAGQRWRAGDFNLERLEDRTLFGFYPAYNTDETPIPIVPCVQSCGCPTPLVSGGPGEVNNPGPATTEAPVRSYDGLPAISATDIQSTAFNMPWGVTRTWTGLNNSGPVGNGWSMGELPYLVVGGGTEGSYAPGGGGFAAPPGSVPDDRISVVEGGMSTYTFWIPTSAPYGNFFEMGGQPIPASLSQISSGGSTYLEFNDGQGNLIDFYDVERDTTQGSATYGKPIPVSRGADPSKLYGQFKSYTAVGATVTVSAQYNVDGSVGSLTRHDAASGDSEQLVFTYATVSNDLGGWTFDALASNIALWRNGQIIRQANYDYYTGRIPDGAGGYVNDPSGRLGDLRSVTIEDSAGNVLDHDYYRYYKFTGESDEITSQGPTNNEATTGGPDPLQPAIPDGGPIPYSDAFVFSGLKTVVAGAALDRLSAAMPGGAYLNASDAAIQPYVTNYFTYERWADHVGADGAIAYGSAGYNNNAGFDFRVGYRYGSRYRATSEIAQGTGCSSCSSGQGSYKYDYAANYYSDSIGLGLSNLSFNTWTIRQTEYLPDDTAGTWADNDRQITYTNEVGQPLLDVSVHVSKSTFTIIAAQGTSGGMTLTTGAANGLQVGDVVALSGILPESLDGVFTVTDVNTGSNTFTVSVPATYTDGKGFNPFVNTTVTNGDGSTIAVPPGGGSKVLSQQETYFHYSNMGQLVEKAMPSAMTGYNDNNQDPGGGFVAAASGEVQTWRYTGWDYSGNAGVIGNGATTVAAPEGAEAGFVQGTGAFSQAVNGWSAGTFTLSFQAANASGDTAPFQVSVDGTVLTFNAGATSTINPSATYTLYTSDPFTVPAGPHTIAFTGTDSSSLGTSMVDAVAINGNNAPGLLDAGFEATHVSATLDSGIYDPAGCTLNPGYPFTPYAIAGYLEASYLQQGSSGMPALQECKTFYIMTDDTNVEVPFFGLATDTVYGNDNGTDARTTNYSHTWVPGTPRVQSMTVSQPVIGAAQNGPGTADTDVYVYNAYGEPVWHKDADGYIDYTAYDPATGATLKHIDDVNTNDTSDFSRLPSGWATRAGGGLELITTYTPDTLGRTIEQTDPDGNITYTVYNDPAHEVRVYPGWHFDGSQWTTTGPVQVSQQRIWGTLLSGQATAAGTNSIDGKTSTLIDATNLSVTGNYVGCTLVVTGGTDAGQTALVTGYDPSTRALTLSPQLAAATDSTTQYTLSLLYNQTLTTSAAPAVDGSGKPTGQETLGASNIQSLSRSLTNNAGQTIEQDDYFSLAGTAYSADAVQLGASSNNSASGNFHATLYHYTSRGWLDRTVDPTGTITREVYDWLGRVAGTWLGTNDTPASGWWSPTNNTSPSNMVDVADYAYDNGGVGDGNLTETVQHPGGGAADRVTLNLYDWRDRLIGSKAGALSDSSGNPNPAGETDGAHRLITFNTYDNLSEQTATRTYAGDGVSLADFANWTSTTDASLLRAYSTQSFDDQGRVYLAQTYSVDPSLGTVGSWLATNTYYDHRSNVIETSAPGGLVTKHALDGAGRDTIDSTTDGGVLNGAAQTWANAGTTASDVVIEQTLNSYDAASNLIGTIDRQRFDSDPTLNGPSTTATGDLQGPLGGSLASRDYYTAYYYDAALRLTDSVNVGTNGGVNWARPLTVPAGSNTVLVTHDDYDSAGNLAFVTDPRGIVSATYYDLLGRKKKTVAALAGMGPDPTPTATTNQTTAYTYNGDRNLLTMTAVMPSGTPSQTTAYVYGTTSTSGVFSNALLAKVEYPDLTTGAASTAAANDETFTYNALGEKTGYTDRNGTIHAYAFDVLGRLTGDVVTALGSGVSNQTLALGYTFNDAGLPFQQTSYSDAAMTMVQNQVQDAYNGYGQLAKQYQDQTGPVATDLTSVTINDGSVQRSMIWSVTVTFDQPVTLASGAISLTQRAAAGDAVGSGAAVSFVATPSADGTSVVLTFPGGTGASLANGVYDLTVHMNLVNRQSDGTPLGGGDQTRTFYRYFGDAYGTGNVTGADYALFKKALTTYNPVFDYNGDGVVDNTTDYPAFTADLSGGGYDLYTAPAAGVTQAVAYAYGGTNASRLTRMTYPNGRQEDYVYNAGLDDAISRASAIADDGGSAAGTVAAYTYLGLNTIVQVRDGNGIELTYIQQSGDANAITDAGDRYTGLDRFGRVDDQFYVNTSTGAAVDRIQYGHDRGGNVLYARNLVNGSFSELYHASSTAAGDDNSAYDPLNRITSFSRGTLTSSGNNGSTLDTITPANLNSTSGVPNQNSWNLDALGNWDSGAGSTNTFNAQNEETANGSHTLAYDNGGDMTTDELGNAYLFDAWGRVVQISNSSGTMIASLAYDALGRNVVLRTPGTESGTGFALLAYDAAGRQAQSSYMAVYSQYVWGLAYVNDLVLRDSSSDGNLGIGGNAGLGQREYAQHDSQFSVISVTDASGNVTQRFVYDPYGKATPLTAAWAYDANAASRGPAGADDWRVQFQGMMLINDGPSGGNVEQSDTRVYNVDLGRWGSQDRGRYIDGPNLYQIEDSDPADQVDPLGLVGAGLHHPYPKYLGGAKLQPLADLDAAEHTAAHRYFSDRGFGGPSCRANASVAGRAKWKQLTEPQQRQMIEESLRAAGVDEAWIAESMDGIMANATPGVVQGGGSKLIPVGSVAGVLLIVLTSETALAASDINSSAYIDRQLQTTIQEILDSHCANRSTILTQLLTRVSNSVHQERVYQGRDEAWWVSAAGGLLNEFGHDVYANVSVPDWSVVQSATYDAATELRDCKCCK